MLFPANSLSSSRSFALELPPFDRFKLVSAPFNFLPNDLRLDALFCSSFLGGSVFAREIGIGGDAASDELSSETRKFVADDGRNTETCPMAIVGLSGRGFSG